MNKHRLTILFVILMTISMAACDVLKIQNGAPVAANKSVEETQAVVSAWQNSTSRTHGDTSPPHRYTHQCSHRDSNAYPNRHTITSH